MPSYRLRVLQETGNKSPEDYFVRSRKSIDPRVLAVAGLLLDGGIEQSVVWDQLQVAESYVCVSAVSGEVADGRPA